MVSTDNSAAGTQTGTSGQAHTDIRRTRRVAVTGAAGFVGGAVARGLADSQRVVTALSRRGDTQLPGCTEAAGDLRSEGYVREALEDSEIIFHVAARVGVIGSWLDFEIDNVHVTENILRLAAQAGAHGVILTSSPSVVFDGSPIEGGDETLPMNPLSWAKYPVTKARAEERAVELTSELGLRTIILRPHLVWGPGDRHLAPSLTRLIRRQHLLCPDRQMVTVDPTHISDVVSAHVLAGERIADLDAGETRRYFITGGQPTALWPLAARLVSATCGRSVKPRYVPVALVRMISWAGEQLAEATGERVTSPVPRFAFESSLQSQWFDISRAASELGYVPRMSVQDGLTELVALAGVRAMP